MLCIALQVGFLVFEGLICTMYLGQFQLMQLMWFMSSYTKISVLLIGVSQMDNTYRENKDERRHLSSS